MGNLREYRVKALVFVQITHELSPHDFGEGMDPARAGSTATCQANKAMVEMRLTFNDQ